MGQTDRAINERMFTIELKSKGDVKNVSLAGDETVLIEGSIGPLKRAQFLDDLVLEVIGINGILRVDLSVNDLHLHPHKADVSNESRRSRQ